MKKIIIAIIFCFILTGCQEYPTGATIELEREADIISIVEIVKQDDNVLDKLIDLEINRHTIKKEDLRWLKKYPKLLEVMMEKKPKIYDRLIIK